MGSSIHDLCTQCFLPKHLARVCDKQLCPYRDPPDQGTPPEETEGDMPDMWGEDIGPSSGS